MIVHTRYTHLTETVHLAVVADNNRYMRFHGVLARFVYHDFGEASLDDMDGHAKRASQGLNLGFSAPLASICDRATVLLELRWRHQPVLLCACAIFTSNGREEGEEVIWVRKHVI